MVSFGARSFAIFCVLVSCSPALAVQLEAPLPEPAFVRVQTKGMPAAACLTVDELIELELALRSKDAARIGDKLLNTDCLLLSASSHGQAKIASSHGYAWVEFDHAQPVDAVTMQPVPDAAGPAAYWISGASLVDMFSGASITDVLDRAVGR